jgi:hypothetical protein
VLQAPERCHKTALFLLPSVGCRPRWSNRTWDERLPLGCSKTRVKDRDVGLMHVQAFVAGWPYFFFQT